MNFNKRAAWICAASIVLLPTLWIFARPLLQPSEPRVFWGVPMGVGPADVRRLFAFADRGSFRFDGSNSELPALDWEASAVTDDPNFIRSARFEFHGGMVVAIRVRGNAARTVRAFTSPSLLVRQTTTPDQVPGAIVISRHCPLHQAEVSNWISTSS